MEPEAVRAHAQATCDALVAGDIDRAADKTEPRAEVKHGPVRRPSPTAADERDHRVGRTRGSSGFNVVLHLVGDTSEVRLQTRWKDRDGEPTIIEASNLTENAIAAAAAGTGETETSDAGEAEADSDAES